jgi:site-specific DNA-methyltransferase (adenine-specific)
MKPYLSAPEFDLWHGDCIEVMRTLPDNSVDSVVTDPPYELGFMGKGWDNSGIAYRVEVWAEALRVLKPGGHLLAFGGTRTAHRLACAIEDAGFDIRDSIAWMYGSGFPKSLDVSKAIDKNNGEVGRLWKFTAFMRSTGLTAKQLNEVTDTFMGGHYLTGKSQPAIPTPELWQMIRPSCGDVPEWVDDLVARIAAEREVTGQYETPAAGQQWMANYGMSADLTAKERRDNPATDAAKQWQGWGTALKPAHEPIVVARKPLIGTVAENVQAHGTGALNIGACRIDMGAEYDPAKRQRQQSSAGDVPLASAGLIGTDIATYNPAGRWPANVILDESQAAELDRQSGVQKDGVAVRHRGVKGGEIGAPGAKPEGTPDIGYGGEGGASRFFYTAKANSAERPRVDDVAHPTVKPLDLMRYLVRLVTPPGGVVLEPFGGSGTTIEACVIEGFRCIAIELTEEYLTLIAQRLTKPIQVTLL